MKNILITLLLTLTSITTFATSLTCTPIDSTQPIVQIEDLNQNLDPYTNKYHITYENKSFNGYGIVDEGRLGLNLYEVSDDHVEYFSAIISGYPKANGTYLMNFRFQAQPTPDEYICTK